MAAGLSGSAAFFVGRVGLFRQPRPRFCRVGAELRTIPTEKLPDLSEKSSICRVGASGRTFPTGLGAFLSVWCDGSDFSDSHGPVSVGLVRRVGLFRQESSRICRKNPVFVGLVRSCDPSRQSPQFAVLKASNQACRQRRNSC